MELAWHFLQALLFSRQYAEGVLASLSNHSWAYGREGCWWCLIIAYRDQNQVNKLYRRIIGIYLNSYVCLIRLLLALNFIFSKTKMLKPLFILFIKQLLGNVTSDIDIYSARQSIIQRVKAEWW